MAKKKHKHKHRAGGFRNAAPRSPAPRNAAPRAPRASKSAEPEDTPLRRLGYTAAGAAGTALMGSLLAREGFAPKTIAGVLTAVGGGLAWQGKDEKVRNLGAGTMSAAGSQLALLMLDDHEHGKKADAAQANKRANADGLPVGALESAFERARARLAVSTDDARRYADAA